MAQPLRPAGRLASPLLLLRVFGPEDPFYRPLGKQDKRCLYYLGCSTGPRPGDERPQTLHEPETEGQFRVCLEQFDAWFRSSALSTDKGSRMLLG